MKTIYKFFSLLLLCLVANMSTGQTIGFNYDASGNRISRVIVMKEAKVNDSLKLKQTTVLGNLMVTIYPNPNKGRFSVEIRNKPDSSQVEIDVFTLSGVRLYQNKQPLNKTTIYIKDKPGIYFINVIIDRKKQTWKIIKE